MVSVSGSPVFSLANLEAAIDCLLALTPDPFLLRLFWFQSIIPLLMINPIHSIFICMIFIVSVPFSQCLGRV